MFPEYSSERNFFVVAFHSNLDESNVEGQQDLDLDLSGKIRELVSANDMDMRFEPAFDDRKFDQYNSYGLEDDMPSLSVIVARERVLSRQERSVTWMYGLAQTSSMDGSGITIEGSSSISIEGSKYFLTVYI